MSGSDSAPGNVPNPVGGPSATPEVRVTPSDLHRSLLGRCTRGEPDALGELYDATSAVLYPLALRITGNREDSEEVLLDVYAKAWRNASAHKPERGSVLSWLVAMTRSAALDRFRSNAARGRRFEPFDGAREVAGGRAPPVESAVYEERRRRVATALDELPREQREAIELAYFSGLSHSEIADRLGAPLGTVKTRLRLAAERLRILLEDLS